MTQRAQAVWLPAVFGGAAFAWVIAARQALDVTTGRAVAICVLAQIPGLILIILALMTAAPVVVPEM